MIGVIPYGVSVREDSPDQLRISFRLCAGHKKRRGHAMTPQKLQQPRGNLRIRPVIEGQGDRPSLFFPPADHGKEESESGEKGGNHTGENE